MFKKMCKCPKCLFELILCSNLRVSVKITLTLCQGNHRDANFQVGLPSIFPDTLFSHADSSLFFLCTYPPLKFPPWFN